MFRWGTTANCQYETLGAVTASSTGTEITSNASANAKGAWTNIGSTTSFPYSMLWVMACGDDSGVDYVVDIGISVSGNRFILFPDFRICSLNGTRHGSSCVGLPLQVPSGSQLSARCAASTGNRDARILLVGGSNSIGGHPGYSRVEALYTPALSRGTDLDPTVANTKTSWVELSSGISFAADAILIGIGSGADVTRTGPRPYLLDVGMGGAGSEYTLLSNLFLNQSALADVPEPYYLGPFPAQIPASTRIAVRAQISDVTVGERKLDVAAWAFLP